MNLPLCSVSSSSRQCQNSNAKKKTAKRSRAPARSRAQARLQVHDARPTLLLTPGTIPCHSNPHSAPFDPPQNPSLTIPQFYNTEHELLTQHPQNLHYYLLPPQGNGYAEANLDAATSQESTFPSSSNLAGVIRNEQTHPRFSPYPGIYQATSAYGLDPAIYNSFSSHSKYYTNQPDESESPFFQADQSYATYPLGILDTSPMILMSQAT
jgi:hypothetical protein